MATSTELGGNVLVKPSFLVFVSALFQHSLTAVTFNALFWYSCCSHKKTSISCHRARLNRVKVVTMSPTAVRLGCLSSLQFNKHHLHIQHTQKGWNIYVYEKWHKHTLNSSKCIQIAWQLILLILCFPTMVSHKAKWVNIEMADLQQQYNTLPSHVMNMLFTERISW